MLFHAAFRVILMISCLMLVGCPTTIKLKLTNEFESKITIIYSTGYESVINTGETKEEIYKFTCIRIKAEGEIIEFLEERPPDHYFSISISSSTLYAVFTKEKELKVYQKDNSEVIVLKSGC